MKRLPERSQPDFENKFVIDYVVLALMFSNLHIQR